jgi:hypothetical protein
MPGFPARLTGCEAFHADHSFDDIARELGRSRASIASCVADLGLRRHSQRSWLEWEDGELLRRYGEEPTSALPPCWADRSARSMREPSGWA